MTDLIARLAEHIARADCVCVLRHDFPAILHALKVQQAAEAYVDNLGSEKEWIHHANLVSAVKGEQP